VSGGALDLTLVRRGLAGNDRFHGYAAFVPDAGELPRARLPGGLVIVWEGLRGGKRPGIEHG